MRKLYDAALRAPAQPETVKPEAADPTPTTGPAVSLQYRVPGPALAVVVPAAPAGGPMPEAPAINAGLDEASSTELAALLDEQHRRIRRQRRRQSLIALGVLFGFAGGGYAWFIQSPQRVQAFREATHDIRSVGDVASVVSKFNKALEKIKVHAAQVDNATTTMGIDPAKDDGKDPYLESEMKEMMGGEGKTTGERNRLLKERFGGMEKTGSQPGVPVPATGTPPPNP
jgi:hypothetical protein